MIKRIIVAFDGSELAREAFAYAVLIARAAKAQILALHVIEPLFPPVVAPDPVVGFDPNPLLAQTADEDRAERKREREKFERLLGELEQHCAESGVACDARIDEGPLLDALVGEARGEDLLAIGMKGRFARAGVGSTTKELVKHGPCPVLVVSGALRPLKRLVGVFDGSPASKRAVAWARSVSEQTGWPLAVLAVTGKQLPTEEADARAAAVAEGAEVLRAAPDAKDVADQIERAAGQAGASLLALAAYEESWLHQLLFGATADHVLRHVHAPVALIH